MSSYQQTESAHRNQHTQGPICDHCLGSAQSDGDDRPKMRRANNSEHVLWDPLLVKPLLNSVNKNYRLDWRAGPSDTVPQKGMKLRGGGGWPTRTNLG